MVKLISENLKYAILNQQGVIIARFMLGEDAVRYISRLRREYPTHIYTLAEANYN